MKRRVPANAAPEAYDDREVVRQHSDRLNAAYDAYCARTPAGFKPVNRETWLATVGDLTTLIPDTAWGPSAVNPPTYERHQHDPAGEQ